MQEISKEIVSQLTASRQQDAALAEPLMRCVFLVVLRGSMQPELLAENGGQLKLSRPHLRSRFCGERAELLSQQVSAVNDDSR